WSEQRVRARLGPQIDSMASELNNQLQQLLAGTHPVLRLHASHGYAVALLPEFSDRLELDLRYCNQSDALLALDRGDCDIASFHLPTCPDLAARARANHDSLLADDDLRIIRFVTRREGLMTRRGHKPAITGLADLTRPGLTFINRDQHSGTRFLFRMLLEQQGLAEHDIRGAQREEFTHSAVAAHVAAGMADAGFGVEMAAHQFSLDFLHLATEHYFLVCHTDSLAQNNLRKLLELMRSDTFLEAIGKLPGYQPDRCGEVCTFSELLASTRAE
ncbi:MAG: substrate-binding domain-containing protein, partial [Marinobacter sp.]|uniref:substrate-binding domain-containing protein n=1 Tax=Marinobacter sp. TaxID=50741 RepID=UPI00299DE285